MALNANTLKAAIKTKAGSKNPDFAANIGGDLDWLLEAVAEAVVEHIVANAVVVVNVTSVSGVTPGSGVSGPGTGTGTIS